MARYISILVAFAACVTSLVATADPEYPQVGKQIKDFQLPDYLGAPQALSKWKDKPAVVGLCINNRVCINIPDSV